MDKRALRKEFLSARKKLTYKDALKKSAQICRKVLKLDELQGGKTMAAYLSFNNEVDTKEIIDSLTCEGKRVVVPQFRQGDWRFALFSSWDNLEEGTFGILQPKSASVVDSSAVDVVLIPGIAFDEMGIRLGYGKGVFDKLLANSRAYKIGLAYDFQIVDKLPREKHDLIMDLVVTEKRVIEFRV